MELSESKVVEPWILASFLATKTQSIRFVLPVSRDLSTRPGILAKMAASLDLLSRGRLILGVPAEISRSDSTDELLRLLFELWSGDVDSQINFEGKYFKLKNAESAPKPARKPHPEMLIELGNSGESRSATKLAASYADIALMNSSKQLGGEEEELRTACLELNRDYSTIKRAVKLGLEVEDLSKVNADYIFLELPPSGGLDTLKKKRLNYH